MKHLVALVAGAQGEELTVDFECGKASAMRAHVVFETAEAKACEVRTPFATPGSGFCLPWAELAAMPVCLCRWASTRTATSRSRRWTSLSAPSPRAPPGARFPSSFLSFELFDF